ncbi:hypothetical protein BDY21DRAFT_271657, partial [Lineolata rhizophorae]
GGDDDAPRAPVSWPDKLNATDWAQFAEPRNVVPTLLLTGTTLLFAGVYRAYLRRVPDAGHVGPGMLRGRRRLLGVVTSVGDGDGFRLFHTPGGRLAGWGWGWGRKVPTGKELGGKTIHVRIAGIDAPELAHFGRPEQPYAQDALRWLTSYILGRRVRAHLHRRDQYDRVVATVFVRRGPLGLRLLRRDVGLEMLKRGLATVYEAKSGVEFGGREEKYKRAERRAREKGRGMWKEQGLVARLLGRREAVRESPREYKTRMAALDKEKE